MRFVLMSMPRVRSTRTAFGCSGLGSLPALRASIAPADICSMSASAICDRALLPVHRNNTRRRRPERSPRGSNGRHAATRNAGCSAPPAASNAWRQATRSIGVVAVATVRRASARPTPGRRRAAVAGDTTPGSAVRRPAPSAPTRTDHCAPAPAANASAPDSTPTARTAAERPGHHERSYGDPTRESVPDLPQTNQTRLIDILRTGDAVGSGTLER